MPTTLAHILKGLRAGRIVEMPEEDLQTAMDEKWAEPVDKVMTRPVRGVHKQSDAYFKKVADARDKARGVGKYANRMLRTGGPSERPEPQEPPTPIIDTAPAPEAENEEAGAAKRGPGRPKKTTTKG